MSLLYKKYMTVRYMYKKKQNMMSRIILCTCIHVSIVHVQENIECLSDEPRSPKYNSYFVCESLPFIFETTPTLF